MKFATWILAASLLPGAGSGLATGAEIEIAPQRTYVARHAYVPRIPPYVCNDYGRCWSSRLVTPEDYASGHLMLVNRVNRRAGYCKAYRFQYPVGWDECLGDWDYGRGRIYH